MTTPKINTLKRGGSRLYVHPNTDDKVPGVTSVLNMRPKGFLKYWAAKAVAEFAVNNLPEILGLTLRAGPQAAIDTLKRAPDRDVNKAADFGTEVHDLFERRARGEDVGRVHPDMEPFMRAYDAFVTMFQPRFIFIEGTVWSETHGYAGSFDWIAEITDPDTGTRHIAIGDWKTTRSGVHEDVSLQLSAYKHADYIITPEGEKVDIPDIEVGLVVHARPEAAQVVQARIDDVPFKAFLALLAVWHNEQDVMSGLLAPKSERIQLDITPPKRKPRATPAR